MTESATLFDSAFVPYNLLYLRGHWAQAVRRLFLGQRPHALTGKRRFAYIAGSRAGTSRQQFSFDCESLATCHAAANSLGLVR